MLKDNWKFVKVDNFKYLNLLHFESETLLNYKMDYSYLNQAAATFDSSCLQSSMDPTGLGNMPCSYGDLTSCSQMSQAAYRYTAAAASMARSYNPVGAGPGNVTMSALHHAGPASQCSVMGARAHQDVHRASMFQTSMNLQCK